MKALNPYEPSGGVANSQVENRNRKSHFLAFVSTFIVLQIAISSYQFGFEYVVPKVTFLKLIRLAGLAIILWLPHPFVAMRSFKASRAGARLFGVVGASLLGCGFYAISWILDGLILPFPLAEYVGFLVIALSVLQSLAAVAILGNLWSKVVASKRNRATMKSDESTSEFPTSARPSWRWQPKIHFHLNSMVLEGFQRQCVPNCQNSAKVG